MEKENSIKKILSNKIKDKKTKFLFNKKVLDEIEKDFKRWKENKVSVEDKEQWEKIPYTILGSDTPRELIYTPLSIRNLDYLKEINFSGEEPYLRGIHSNMYRGRKFTMRQLTGFGSPEHTNKRIKFMLKHGATGLNVLFDIPTIQMYDSDDPMAIGQVGMSGVCVDSVDDIHLIFEDIPIDEISVSLVTHFPSNTAILFSMFLVAAEERGISWEKLRGSVQNDTTMEELVRSAPEYIPPKDCFRLQCDNIEFIKRNVPKWNYITLNGYNLREFGTSSITEMAVALSNGVELLKELINRGYNVDVIADRISFFWSIGNDFFEEVARLRAIRRLWYKIMKYFFNAKNSRSMWMRCHVQTSGVSLFQQEPLNNIIRAGYHALAAVLGGVQSLHVDSYDEAFSVPTEQAALLSLRIQQILQEETAITDVVDPLGGSFYVESLTNTLEEKILNEVDEIENEGGYVSSIESGILYKKIVEYFTEQQKRLEDGEIKVVGYNVYKSDVELPNIDMFRYPEGVEEIQVKRLKKLREKRNSKNVKKALNNLKKACLSKENIFPYCIECARARCTIGEISNVFKDAFGLWYPKTTF